MRLTDMHGSLLNPQELSDTFERGRVLLMKYQRCVFHAFDIINLPLDL